MQDDEWFSKHHLTDLMGWCQDITTEAQEHIRRLNPTDEKTFTQEQAHLIAGLRGIQRQAATAQDAADALLRQKGA